MDKFYVELRHYLVTGTYHGMTKTHERLESRKSTIRRSSKQYTVKEGKLFYVGPRHTYMRLVVMSDEERKRVLLESHRNPATGAHFGVRSTRNKATAGYYWSSLHRDVIEWVTSCDHCQLHKTLRTLPRAVHSIKVYQAWEVLGMDLIGPLPETPRENKFIVAMTDLFTKWVVAEPLRCTSESEVAAAIVGKLQTFGLVQKILTHQEKSYVDQLNEKIFAALQVVQSVSTSLRPQKNRKVARTTKAIKQALWQYVNNQHDDWDLHLPSVVYNINVTPPAPGKLSPFYLMFNRVPLLPQELNACPGGDALEVGNAEDEIDNVIISDRLPQSLLLPRDADEAPKDPVDENGRYFDGRLDRQLVRVAFHHDHYYWTSEPGKLAYEMG